MYSGDEMYGDEITSGLTGPSARRAHKPVRAVKQRYLLGRGRLTWGGSERRSDRYGFVYLLGSGDSTTSGFDPAPIIVPPAILGKRCKLLTVVTETRESTHIGDLFHAMLPRTPKVGDSFTLGEGELVTADDGEPYVLRVGILPDDNRECQWLNMRALYDNHEQTVELIAEVIS